MAGGEWRRGVRGYAGCACGFERLSVASGQQPDVMALSDNWGCATPKQEGSSLE
jgi:hypothetical protein